MRQSRKSGPDEKWDAIRELLLIFWVIMVFVVMFKKKSLESFRAT